MSIRSLKYYYDNKDKVLNKLRSKYKNDILYREKKKTMSRKRWKQYYNKEKAQAWYKSNKVRINLINRARYLKYKNIVYDYYGRKCNCCGESMISMLTIDHVNNDGNIEKEKGIVGEILLRKIISQNFPKNYQILCMNCNWSKRMNNGSCEHKLTNHEKE